MARWWSVRLAWLLVSLAFLAVLVGLARADANLRWPAAVTRFDRELLQLAIPLDDDDWAPLKTRSIALLQQWERETKGIMQLNTDLGEVTEFEMQLVRVRQLILQENREQLEVELPLLHQHWSYLRSW